VKRPVVLAVDGGGSKVDAVLLARDGTVIEAVRVRSLDHDESGSLEYLDGVVAAVGALCRKAGLHPDRRPVASLGVYCLAGADLPADYRRIRRWLAKQGWTEQDLLRNDTFAVLRGGTKRGWGVGVVCGYGVNCAGVAPDGRTFRFPAIGMISGDWGGGGHLGGEALWHAIRSEDGRGPKSALATLVPAHFGLKRPHHVMEAIYFDRISSDRLAELAPLVFRAAIEGDPVARGVVDRQADEVVLMAGTAIRKLRMTGLDVHVVLGGGIFRNGDPAFFERIEEGLREIAPNVCVAVLTAPPVVGAALLGLDRIGASNAAKAKVLPALTHDRLTRDTQTSDTRIGRK
jgi:N-acetylglucosamine kinase-like BadF-type ATPase